MNPYHNLKKEKGRLSEVKAKLIRYTVYGICPLQSLFKKKSLSACQKISTIPNLGCIMKQPIMIAIPATIPQILTPITIQNYLLKQ